MSDCSTNAFALPEAPLEYVDELMRENAALRECIADMWPRAAFTMSTANKASWEERLRSLGIEACE